MKKNLTLTTAALCTVGQATATLAESAAESAKPNIIYIFADDLGYGDVHCLNPQHGKIPTPNIDRLASQGMIFTDAHASASVCTPSRYSILTGRYNWRSRLQHGVLGGYDEPLIAKERLTVPALLRQQGYATAIIGKWHLGMSAPGETEAMKAKFKTLQAKDWKQVAAMTDFDWTQPIADGPTTRGFDYFFGLDTPNTPPYCFIENDRTVGIPTGTIDPKLVAKYEVLAFPGAALPGWNFEDILPTLTGKACDYISRQAKTGKPFFLYYAMTSPHTPTAPSKEWQGKSGLGKYGDFVMETDAMVGRVLAALEAVGMANNTLVILSSDNGACEKIPSVHQTMAKGHRPSAQFRGYKSDVWDGGHRLPFIARWPGVVKPGATCGQLTGEMDLMATCAEITGAKLPDTAGEDSISFLPLLKGGDQSVRETLVHHSVNGNFAIREGKWKLVLCPGSGGWSNPPQAPKGTALPQIQLYDMSADEGENKNLQAQHPGIVKRLTEELKTIVADGRSTPGPKQQNDVPVNIHKQGKPK